MLRGVFSKLNDSSDKIQVLIKSGMRDNVGQGMLFSSDCVYWNKILNCWYISYFRHHFIHSFASVLRSVGDIHLRSVTLEVLWWRCKTHGTVWHGVGPLFLLLIHTRLKKILVCTLLIILHNSYIY